MRRSLVKGLVIAVVFGVSTARLFRSSPGVQVTTAAVTLGPIQHPMTARGVIEPVSTVTVSTQVAGTIRTVEAENSSVVHTGQVLARLDPSSYRATLDETRAVLAQARADRLTSQLALDGAQEKLERSEYLIARSLVARIELDAARAGVMQAEAELSSSETQVTAAEAAVDDASVNLFRTVIRSPVDGVIVGRDANVGEVVTGEGESPVLFRIATDLTHLQIDASLDRRDVASVEPGASVAVQVPSYPDETFYGIISEIASAPLIEIVNPDAKLRPGMTATVEFENVRRANTIRIPNLALSFRPSPQLLKAADADQAPDSAAIATPEDSLPKVWEYNGLEFRAIAVRTGLSDGEWTELVTGEVRPGDLLVTSASVRPEIGAMK